MTALSASPLPPRSDVVRALRIADAKSRHVAISRATYNDLRRSFILIEHDREQGALLALLRIDPAEHQATRGILRRLGFHPNASPERWSISWRRDVVPSELRAVARSVHDAFDGEAVLDIGASYAPQGRSPISVQALAPFWPGSFVLHVGGTRRCVVFGAEVDERDLALAFDAERDAYFTTDLVVSTE